MGILAATVAPEAITVVTDTGQTMSVTTDSHRNYDQIRKAIKIRDYDEAQRLIDLASEMAEKFASISGNVSIKHGVLYFGDREIGGVLGERAVQMHEEGFDMGPMFAFVENLYQNPSRRSVQQLYGFLEATDLPITEDGHFLAYKMVRQNYTDCHTGTFDNSVGAVPEMPRNEVDENPDNTCSSGLHFCSQKYLGYLRHSGPRTMIVKVNPADVVSIPTDYNNAKGRACKYKIIGEFKDTPGNDHTWEKSVADESMMKTGFAKASIPGRETTVSGGVTVMTDDLFENGDVVFKRAVADHIGMDIEDLVDAVDAGVVETRTTAYNHKLIVWREDTEEKLWEAANNG